MRAVILDGGFGLDHLKLTERPKPRPAAGELLLRLRFASLNQRDLLMIQGKYEPRLRLPIVVASDALATVEEHGHGVREPALGSRVCPLFASGWYDGDPPQDVFTKTLGGPRDGTLAEYMLINADDVVLLPRGLTDEQAACLPCAGLTAYSALVTLGRLTRGQHVLCLGTGAVSLFALQFAKALGARVTVTSSSEEKLARVEQLGADHVVNYQQHPDWGRLVRRQFGGVDHVIEIGGAETLAQSLTALRPGGTASVIGVLAGHTGPLDLLPILMRQLRLQGVFVGHKRSFGEMLELIAQHRIRPVVGPSFELSQFYDAFQALALQRHFGKICVRIG
jgi:NADPH:quinone reductase-like Zn-dependent oxidoreductase